MANPPLNLRMHVKNKQTIKFIFKIEPLENLENNQKLGQNISKHS